MEVEPRQEQFLRTFLQHQPQLDAYVRSLVLNRADADELLQDVATVLWRKFDVFEPGTRFDQWACHIAHNYIMHYFRRKQHQPLVFDGDVLMAIAEEAAKQNDLWTERSEALTECIKHLARIDGELIQRRFQGGMTNRAMAQQTGRSESAISRALDRIYVALSNCIERRLDSRTGGALS